MTDPTLTIEAFLDGDRVDADALKDALARVEGRDHLVEMLALREVVGGREAAFPAPATRPSHAGRWLAIAALVAMSVAGGYAFGRHTNRSDVSAISVGGDAVPTPTRVIEIKQWQRPANEGN